MKIAMVVNSYPPRVGGLEYHIENLAQGLSDLGHEVWVLTISSTPGRRIDGEVRVLTGRAHLPIADVITLPSLGTTQALTRFLVQHGIDLVSTHTRFFPMSFVGLQAARRAGIPVIHTEHGSGYVANFSPVIVVGSRAVDLTMGRYVLTHADKVLGVSEPAARFAEKLGAPAAEVFYNAITPPQPTPPSPDRPTHLVFVGRVVAGKGWDTFLEAVRRLRERGTEVTGEILGDGAERERAVAYAQELGVSEIVAVRGRVSQEQVRQALRGSTLVNPTVLSEGFQTTLLEAIAERGRVVTFDVPGAYLLRKQGAPVTICESKDAAGLSQALIEMLSAPPGPADPSFITQWTWPVRAAQYATIAEQVIAAQVR